MVKRNPDYFPRRINNYVPRAEYAIDVENGGAMKVSFGAPVVASATQILSAQSIASATGINVNVTFGARYGRNVQVVSDGAATSTVTVIGRDYLGQPMRETLTLNGTTPVLGVKAFKWVDRVTWTATASRTINVGSGSRLGLPYKTVRVLSEEAAGAVVSTVGTLTAPVLTDPQTAVTGDPRGLYTATTTLDGTTEITIRAIVDNSSNATPNGGLHGIKHFF
jgi:hypothetical protein